jgi:DNA-directed RNA polymerase specialized sigma24 family protein
LVEVIALFSNPPVNPCFERFLQIGSEIQGADQGLPSTPRRIYQVQRWLTFEQKEQLLEDYRAGIPIQEIAETYRINRDTVMAQARRAGLCRRKPALSCGVQA